MNSVSYSINSATKNNIQNHLKRCNTLFNPHLSTYVNIEEYADKIKSNAYTFEAWDNEQLIGLVACYLNNSDTKQGYITNVSVEKNYQGKGIAKKLVQQTIDKAIALKFKTLFLEVNVNNSSAISLYQSLGFTLNGRVKDSYTMINRLDEKPNIMVSVCCITYNHANFIREAIESFLMQKTTFPFEILIHDDASTDGSAEIIKEYENKYPDIIKPIYQTENQYQQGRTISPVYQWPRARGKYIALCEGDDYWTDSYKLQKQVDFLEGNTDFAISFHNSIIANQFDRTNNQLLENPSNYKTSDIFLGKIIPTQTVLFRNTQNFPVDLFKTINGDTLLFCLIANQTNKGAYFHHDINDSIYRHHEDGVWSKITVKDKYMNSIKTMSLIYKRFKKYRKEIKIRIFQMLKQYFDVETDKTNKFVFSLKTIEFGIKNFEIGFTLLIARKTIKHLAKIR